jgi:hypothetical protein
MALLELQTPRHVEVVAYKDWHGPKGRGLAIMVETAADESQLWTVVFNETGQVWEVPCTAIRFTNNISLGRYVKDSQMAKNKEQGLDIDSDDHAQAQWDTDVPENQPSKSKPDAVDLATEKPSIHGPQVHTNVDHQEKALKAAGHRSHYSKLTPDQD